MKHYSIINVGRDVDRKAMELQRRKERLAMLIVKLQRRNNGKL